MKNQKPLRKTLRVLITGGPTRAYLDDFRYLSNHSTGEVALHLCQQFIKAGVATSLVSGPCAQPFGDLKLKHWAPVETHREMLAQVLRLCKSWQPHFVVFSAAVLDFEPAKVLKGKVSSKGNWTIKLSPTPKIIEVVRKKFSGIQRVGFKLEPGKFSAKKALTLAQNKAAEGDLWALCVNYHDDVGAKKHAALVWNGSEARIVTTKKDLAAAIVQTVI